MIKSKLSILKNEKIMLVLSFLFFIFMMLFHLMHSDLWGDEWVEYYYSQEAIRTGALYNKIILTFQPPLYNYLMHFWLKISTTLLWFRLFNVVLGCFSFGFLYGTLSILINRKVAAIVPCILAICYQWIYCIQECSEYALMLCCVFGAIMFYVKCYEKFNYLRMIGFILCNVLAIYSQYGSVFVVLPLLLLFFFEYGLKKQTNKKTKIIVFSSYIFSAVVFAAPLYFKFAKLQLEHNQIAENTVGISSDLFNDMPFTFGKIISYLFHVNSNDYWPLILGMLGVILFAISLHLIKDEKIETVKKSLLAGLWSGYILHYLLVQFHVYAMVHPNQSAGFLSRYSYFYIPIIFVVLPVIINEYVKRHKSEKSLKRYICLLLGGTLILTSAVTTLKNWNKTYDRQFAKIWMQNEGWKDTTYLYGVAYFGFDYYVSHSDNYQEGYLDNATTEVDDENLPKRFWAWRTGWSGDGWQVTVDKAKELGYTVDIYYDYSSAGQLAYCYIE